MANNIVAGEMYYGLDGQLHEIKRQLRQPGGYPHDPELLKAALQNAIEGKFGGAVSTTVVQAHQTTHLPSPLSLWITEIESLHRTLTGTPLSIKDRVHQSDKEKFEKLLSRTDLIPVYDPGTITNRDAVNWAKQLNTDIWEEVDVNNYSGSEATGKPTLIFIRRSLRPDEDTLTKDGLSPEALAKRPTTWLTLRGYVLADMLHFKVTGEHLDPQTWTWFPNNRLPRGGVACGSWAPGRGEVGLRWSRADCACSRGGARSAVLSLTLVP